MPSVMPEFKCFLNPSAQEKEKSLPQGREADAEGLLTR
jgi:hypothetical protein